MCLISNCIIYIYLLLLQIARFLASASWVVAFLLFFFLSSYVTDQVDVVVEMAHKVLTDVLGGTACVANELSFGHFVLDMRAGQIDGQKDE